MKSMNEWMNEWEWINENEWMRIINEKKEWMNEWMNEWMIEQLSH